MSHLRPKILITGAAGQLAAGLMVVFAKRGDIFAVDIADLDITDGSAVRQTVRSVRPDVVLNCAAWNDVDGAEDHPLDALKVNALGAGTLGAAAAAVNAIFVHYSTDFVFDGESTTPYIEGDSTYPTSVYGISKLAGEMLISNLPRTFVLRLESLFGGPRSRSTTDGIIRAVQGGTDVRVFVDRTVTLSYVPDVAYATQRLLDLAAPAGVYHVVNSGVATWDEVAREVSRRLETEATLVATRMADAGLRARRPRFCALSNAKLTSLGIRMPHWSDALARHIEAVSRLSRR